MHERHQKRPSLGDVGYCVYFLLYSTFFNESLLEVCGMGAWQRREAKCRGREEKGKC